MASLAARLAALPKEARDAALAALSAADQAALEYAWHFWRRDDQTPPDGDWRTWALIAGRGAGKTWTGAHWVREQIETGRRKSLAIVAPTHLAARKILVEGESGILSVCPPGQQPTYEMAIGKLTWPNGGTAHLLTSETPERVRGYNFDGGWCDELAAWENAEEMWTQLALSMRLRGPRGDAPQIVVTTTPRALPLLKDILADPGTVVTRASTFANRANLSEDVLTHLRRRYEGTSLGRQELYGEIIEDADGALWKRHLVDANRVAADAVPDLRRVVVGVDPSGGGAAETGIVAAGVGTDGHGYILRDWSGKYSPDGWARRAVDLYRELRADRVVAERNYGGEMVQSALLTVDQNVSLRMVNASRGKALRAEPVVALYEQGRIHHVGQFPALEDQMCQWDPNSNMPSPDRVDALTWAITDLLLGEREPHPARWLRIDFMGR